MSISQLDAREGDTAKKAKQVQPATGLRSDWRKLVGVNKKSTKRVTSGYEDSNDSITLPSINSPNTSRSSSRASAHSSDVLSNMSTEGTNEIPGVFDDDEGLDSIHVARDAKRRGQSQVRAPAGSGAAITTRTTSSMGLSVSSKDVKDITGPGDVKTLRLKDLKTAHLPLNESEREQFDLLIRSVLDWAGTLKDPFGTNEHPDLISVIQQLWIEIFPDKPKDAPQKDPSIKKNVINRLNNWRSAFGKNAIKVLEDHFKKDTRMRNNTDARRVYVMKLLPDPRHHPSSFPLVYQDPEASTRGGAWLAPLLLKVFAFHLKRVKDAVVSFGYPIGALALATAALERALSLYEVTGSDIREDREPNGSKKSSSYGFDNKPWGSVTSNYAESTSRLSENRWTRIVEGAVEYFGENVASSNFLGPAFGDEVDARGSIAIASDDDEEGNS
ncbi:hypothetical protein F5887DRAFT_1089139 [Amanita rubescens]|nr:hypothetical protein F5887DRAFT_1089139 [Amanita rubescens]